MDEFKIDTMRRELGLIMPPDVANLGVFVSENIANESKLTRTEIVNTRSVETVLARMEDLDGWKTRPAELTIRANGEALEIQALEVVKETRGFKIFFSPLNGNVYKVANLPGKDRVLDKEMFAYRAAQEVFELESTPKFVEVEASPFPNMKALEIPYYGIPVNLWKELTGIAIPPSELDAFKQKMLRLVYEHGLVHQDMNAGNILVRMKDGKPELMAIDWELCSLVTGLPQIDRDPYAENLDRIMQISLAPHYQQKDD